MILEPLAPPGSSQFSGRAIRRRNASPLGGYLDVGGPGVRETIADSVRARAIMIGADANVVLLREPSLLDEGRAAVRRRLDVSW